MSPDPRLVRLLGPDELGWLLQRARRRLERGEPLTGLVTLTVASPAQRDAVARLLGRRPRPGAAITVRWEAVDAVVRRSGVHRKGWRPRSSRSPDRSATAPRTPPPAMRRGRPRSRRSRMPSRHVRNSRSG